MALFLSTIVNKLDKKGRVSVPAPFRLALGDAFMALYPSLSHPALEGCDWTRLEKLSNTLDPLTHQTQGLPQHLAPTSEGEALSFSFFAEAQRLSFDAEGRISLPSSFLQLAQIQEHVAFVGRGTIFELWNPDLFEEHAAKIRQQLQQKRLIGTPAPSSEGGFRD